MAHPHRAGLSRRGLPQSGLRWQVYNRQSTGPKSDLAYDPLTNVQGAWLDEDQLKRSSNGDEQRLSDAEMLIRHIEAVLQANLGLFFGVQECEDLLSSWSVDDTLSPLLQAALPDDNARFGFARLLRGLLRDQIPITAPAEILASIRGMSLAPTEMADAVRAVRLQLKRFLPGNASKTPQIELPVNLETKLESYLDPENGLEVFNIPPDVLHDLVVAIRSLLPSEREGGTLVVRSPELRPYVQRMVDSRIPHLRVLAAEELLSASSPSEQESSRRFRR